MTLLYCSETSYGGGWAEQLGQQNMLLLQLRVTSGLAWFQTYVPDLFSNSNRSGATHCLPWFETVHQSELLGGMGGHFSYIKLSESPDNGQISCFCNSHVHCGRL